MTLPSALPQDVLQRLVATNSRNLAKMYGYSDNRDTASFGWKSNCCSVAYGWASLQSQLQTNASIDVEQIASAVHDGWGQAVLGYWDSTGYGPMHHEDENKGSTKGSPTATIAAEAETETKATAAAAAADTQEEPADGANRHLLHTNGILDVPPQHWKENDFSSAAGYQKYCTRLKLQNTPYEKLSDSEKEKDRVVAELILAYHHQQQPTESVPTHRFDQAISDRMKAEGLLDEL